MPITEKPKELKFLSTLEKRQIMNYRSYSERLDYLLELIEKGVVCSPNQIAEKFNCCDKTARNMINSLRDEGHQISYCRFSKKYYKINI